MMNEMYQLIEFTLREPLQRSPLDRVTSRFKSYAVVGENSKEGENHIIKYT